MMKLLLLSAVLYASIGVATASNRTASFNALMDEMEEKSAKEYDPMLAEIEAARTRTDCRKIKGTNGYDPFYLCLRHLERLRVEAEEARRKDDKRKQTMLVGAAALLVFAALAFAEFVSRRRADAV